MGIIEILKDAAEHVEQLPAERQSDVYKTEMAKLGELLQEEHDRQIADMLAKLPPTTIVDGVRWDRAISYSDSSGVSRCGCAYAPRASRKLRDGRANVHLIECVGCGATWCWGRQ